VDLLGKSCAFAVEIIVDLVRGRRHRASAAPGAAPNAVSIVLNWQQLLKAK
jgi:hypothetical protein